MKLITMRYNNINYVDFTREELIAANVPEEVIDAHLYEEQYNTIDNRRRLLYANVDALRSESAMMRLMGDDQAADDYEKQAVALYQKIRDENPWPMPSNQ